MAGINKEVWLDILMEGFIPADGFLGRSVNLDAQVENNTINIAEAGVDPNVLVNNTTYPIPSSQRKDNPFAIPLDTLDTENTIVRNVEQMESAYDKMASVVRGHKKSLRAMCARRAAHAWSPGKSDSFNPVWAADGAGNKHGYKKISFDMLYAMAAEFQGMDVPMESLVAVLHPYHLADLHAENAKAYKELIEGRKLCGTFDLFITSATAKYNGTTGEKTAFGAVGADTDAISSFMYSADEVMRAMGDDDMFLREKDPEQRADLIGFQKRFIALPMRNKYTGAIYSPKV